MKGWVRKPAYSESGMSLVSVRCVSPAVKASGGKVGRMND